MDLVIGRKHVNRVERGRITAMGTYILFAKSETVLHCFLRVLIEWLALRVLRQSQEEVDKDQCLDKDVTLESEITQL